MAPAASAPLMISLFRHALAPQPITRLVRCHAWQQRVLRVLLVVMCLNASLIWGLHQSMHGEHHQEPTLQAAQSPADSDEISEQEICSHCQIFAHLIAPKLVQADAWHPVGIRLTPGPDLPAPPALTRSWLHFPRDPPDAA